MSYSMVDALAFLQHIGICHRDIKPANLFLLDSGEIKVIDFGESKDYILDEEKEGGTMATIRGTPQYLSPILWKAHMLTPGTRQVEHNIYKSDVFSAGLVLFQLCGLKDVTGFNQKTVYCDGEKLMKEMFANLSKRYSSKVLDLLKKMLIFDEDKRPNFIELGKYVFGDSYDPRVDRTYNDLTNLKKNKNQENTEKNKKKFYLKIN